MTGESRIVRQCKELPGQNLFEYRDDDGEFQVVQSGDVNDYLRAIAGIDVTAKDFRTWAGTRLAASILASLPAPADDNEARHTIAEMAKQVSNELRNTPAVCRASYVHPLIVDGYEQGTLADRSTRAQTRGPRGLYTDERRLLALLRARSEAPSVRPHRPLASSPQNAPPDRALGRLIECAPGARRGPRTERR